MSAPCGECRDEGRTPECPSCGLREAPGVVRTLPLPAIPPPPPADLNTWVVKLLNDRAALLAACKAALASMNRAFSARQAAAMDQLISVIAAAEASP